MMHTATHLARSAACSGSRDNGDSGTSAAGDDVALPRRPETRAATQGLTKLLHDNAPRAVREVKFESYFGRKVAIDASMHIYAFMARARAPGSRSQLTRCARRRWWDEPAQTS